MVVGYLILAVLVVGGFVLGWRFAFRQKPTYGYVIDKREHPGTVYRSVASVAIGGAPMPVIPPRYQLLLDREHQKPNWVDVTKEQYDAAEIGALWWP